MTEASARPSRRSGIRHWMRRGAVFAAVMVITAVVQVVAPPVAHAANPCAGMTPSKRFAGYWHGGSSPIPLEGISANYLDPGGYNLCTGYASPTYNFVTAWSMVASNNSSGGYAQSGVIYRWGDSCPREFAAQNQYGTTNGEVRQYGGCSTPGSVRQIWQQMVGGPCPLVRSNIGATNLLQSTWSPHCGSWTFPLDVEVMGEANFVDTDVPGNPGSHAIFGNMLVQRYIDTVWVGACGNTNFLVTNTNAARWGNSSPDCTQKQIWTK